MFIGHWAPALAVASASKRPGLGTLFVAAQLVDWAFFALLLTGVERMRFVPGINAMNNMDAYHMPLTHSLVGAAGFGLAMALVVGMLTRDRLAAVLAGLVVLGHWPLDWLVHQPDLTLAGHPPKYGLGLWNHPLIEMPLELLITFGALWLYMRKRKPATGRAVALGGTLLALQLFNWFGPQETSVTLWTSLKVFVAYGLVTALAWWMGKSARQPG